MFSGISTAMIAHWPDGIKEAGSFDREPAHLVDLHATFRDLAGVEYLKEYKGNQIISARGLSLAKSFSGEKRAIHDEMFFTFYGKHSAIRQGDWKMVDHRYLYDIKNDRIESNDLSKTNPGKFNEMKELWDELNENYGGKKRKGKVKKTKRLKVKRI